MPPAKCKMAFLNPWSVVNKTTAIKDFIITHKTDVLLICESWLNDDGSSKPQRICQHDMLPSSHELIHMPRPDGKRGGGTAILIKKAFQTRILHYSRSITDQFEYLIIKVTINRVSVRIIVLYRPDPTAVNNLNVNLFWKEFEKFLSKYAVCPEEVIIAGDLNFHLEKLNDRHTLKLNSILEGFGLEQKIQEPTHHAGHTLDVLILHSETELVKDIQVLDPCLVNDDGKLIKDHYALLWVLNIERPKPKLKKLTYRNIKGINYSAVEYDLSVSELLSLNEDDQRSVEELTNLYNTTLKLILDKHAPVKNKTVYVRENTPWFTYEITESKRKRRAAERRMIRSGSVEDKILYRKQCNDTGRVLLRAKLQYYSNRVLYCDKDQKKLFALTNSWMGSASKCILPTNDSQKDLADQFMTFFTNKVDTMHQELLANLDPQNPFIPVMASVDPSPMQSFNAFSKISVSQAEELIKNSNSKHCELDPAPTIVVKALKSKLAKPISVLINKSLSCGVVPNKLKEALIRPSLKKTHLDSEQNLNYRPVSNLPFLSKILEKAVNEQLESYLESNNMISKFQSAYRKNHCTETSLLKVQSDILEALDQGYGTILVMLDISAAFDIVEHSRLLERHKQYFGITGKALEWMASYLNDRTQCVVIGNERSHVVTVKNGFPQGSVLGGKKYNMYSTPLSNIIVDQGVEHKCFADDTQKYLIFKLKDRNSFNSAITKLELCLKQVSQWMSANMLKLNDDKTELMVFAPKHFHSDFSETSITVDAYSVKKSNQSRNLGVILDSSLTMVSQVNSVTKICYYHIKRISKIRKFLTQDAAKSLVHAHVTSRLDYCNSLLALLPAYVIEKLQRVQNSAARLVKRIPVRASITAHRRNLHWLPVKERIKFKVLLMVYKCVNNQAPHYLKTILTTYNPTRNLRSSNQKLLKEIRSRTSFGTRAFSRYGPKLWNQLPLNIKSANSVAELKTVMKTHLFQVAYN